MKPSTPKSLFLTLIILQLFFWTLIPTLVRLSLPLDAIEGYVWGQHFQWGYDRNPWMNALLTHWAVLIGGKSGWLVYGFSQIFVCLGYWAVWKLSQKIFRSDAYALVSVLMLIGVQYTSIASVDFNDNVIELGLWPLLAYFFYEAFCAEKNLSKILYWGLTGITAGLALMTKYYSILPILSLSLFLLASPNARAKFKTPGLYIGGLLCFLICLPHLLWLPSHHYMTMTYALEKAHQIKDPHWISAHPFLYFLWNHFYYALHFGLIQLLTFLGALALLAFAISTSKKKASSEKISSPVKISALSQQFLNFIVIGPFAFTLILSLIFGWKLNTMWGTPLLSLWPLWVLSRIKPNFTHKGLWQISLMGLLVFSAFLIAYAVHNLRDQNTRANFNGAAYSKKITEAWQATHHSPLVEIDGTQNRYLAGYVAFYADWPIRVRINFLMSPK